MKIITNLLKTPFFLVGFGLLIVTFFLALVLPFIYDINTVSRAGLPYMPPNAQHWLGLDHMGLDMVSLLVEGLRASLYVGLLGGIVATLLGTFLGVYAGFMGGIVDEVITLLTNLFIVIPSFVILVLISNSLQEGRSLTLIAIIIGATTWTWSARAVRAQAASLKARDHIGLARINGSSTFRIVLLHILPYLLSYIFMVFILSTGSAILSEAGLSMIGLGPYDTVSLGTILNDALKNEALTDGAWWAFFPATVLITLIVFALYIVNTSMEGVFNPRLRK